MFIYRVYFSANRKLAYQSDPYSTASNARRAMREYMSWRSEGYYYGKVEEVTPRPNTEEEE